MKSLKRRMLNSVPVRNGLAWVMANYIRLVFLTSRKRRETHPSAKPYLTGERNGIFTFWHGRMMVLPAFHPEGKQLNVLISLHRDGKLISRIISHFKHKTIAGSSSRGGATAVKEALRLLAMGENLGITPDGPRGPHQTVSEGTIALARLSGVALIPIAFSSTHCCYLNSWDRFCFALPFGTLWLVVGEPIVVPRDLGWAEGEQLRASLQAIMGELTRRADALAGKA